MQFSRNPIEDPEYLKRQLITYLGNKRKMLGFIGQAVERVKRRLSKEKLVCADLFSGSGIVSRYFKAHTSRLISNDIEEYAAVIGRCFLTNRCELDHQALAETIAQIEQNVNTRSFDIGFIEKLYAPRDENRITIQDRVFYTPDNARRLDRYRQLLDPLADRTRELLLGPLLSSASIHANTAGIFKGFYKNRQTGIGQYGGSGQHALTRIRGQICLSSPILSRFECDVMVYQEDANLLAGKLTDIDLTYIDPPYNQHPYASNYFMLNLLVSYRQPEQISPVSGIPTDWRRSEYNNKSASLSHLADLLARLESRFVLLSFNDEGFISKPELTGTLQRLGEVDTLEIRHNTFRGSRNLRARSRYVTEILFLLEKR